jgi:hypothetical protein
MAILVRNWVVPKYQSATINKYKTTDITVSWNTPNKNKYTGLNGFVFKQAEGLMYFQLERQVIYGFQIGVIHV